MEGGRKLPQAIEVDSPGSTGSIQECETIVDSDDDMSGHVAAVEGTCGDTFEDCGPTASDAVNCIDDRRHLSVDGRRAEEDDDDDGHMNDDDDHIDQNYANVDHGNVDHGNVDHGNVDHGNVDHGNVDHGNVDHGNVDHGNVDHEDIHQVESNVERIEEDPMSNGLLMHNGGYFDEDSHLLLLTPEPHDDKAIGTDYNGTCADTAATTHGELTNVGHGLARTAADIGQECISFSKAVQEAKSAVDAADVKKLRPLFEGCRSVHKFKKLNKISEGTYGAVYRAEDVETSEIVALKLVKYHEKVWAEGVPMPALREVSILLELDNPNIIDVKEVVVGSNDNQVFMVMEYVEHEFGYLLHQRKPEFSTAERKCLLRQLLEALRYLHENWVVHRDLKSSNLLYSNKGLLKVCDFGMSRKFGEPIRPYTRNVVTLWYRAPELMLPVKEYSEKVDLWSAGCVFAEILLHKPLFDGKSEIEMLHKIFKLTGTPTESTWPEFGKLANGKSISFDMYEPSWRSVFPPVQAHFSSGVGSLSHDGLDLLKKLLDPNPETRISAREALQHPYLTLEKPSPTSVQYMPTVPDTNKEAKRIRLKSINEDELRARDAFFDVGSRFEGRVDARRYLQRLESAALAGSVSKSKKTKTTIASSGRR